MFKQALFLALVSMMFLCGCQERRLALTLQDANQAIITGNYEQAERLCNEGLDLLKNSSLPQAAEQRRAFLENLIEIDFKYHQDYQNAIRLLKKLEEFSSPEERYQIKLRIADIYEQNLNLPVEVVFTLREIIPRAEEEERAELDQLYLRLARNLFAIHRYDQAREVIHTLQVNCPDSKLLFKGLVLEANSFFIQEEYLKAVSIYRGLLEGDLSKEEQGVVYFELGSCYQLLSDQKEALSYYKKALAGHPNPQMVQHHITYIQALVDNANVQKQIRRSMLEQAWLRQAYPDQAAHYDPVLK